MFEASGAPAALGSALRATARGGTLVQVGNLPGTAVPAVLGDLVTREITWIGSYRFIDEITDAVQAMHEGLDLSPLITHTFKIDQAVEAIAVAGDRSSGSSKVMLAARTARCSTAVTPDRIRVTSWRESMALLDARRPSSAGLRAPGLHSGLPPIGIGGAESNVAIGLARLGVASTWISRVGDDAFGTFVTREIRAEGVRVHRHPRPGGADRADGQGAPRRAAVAGPLLPQRQRGVPAVAR